MLESERVSIPKLMQAVKLYGNNRDALASHLGYSRDSLSVLLTHCRNISRLAFTRRLTNHIIDGDSILNDVLFNILVKLTESCSEKHIDCDFCPHDIRAECNQVFNVIGDRVHHRMMSFPELVKYNGRLLEVFKMRIDAAKGLA